MRLLNNWKILIRGPLLQNYPSSALPVPVFRQALYAGAVTLASGGRASVAVKTALDLLLMAASCQEVPKEVWLKEDSGPWQAFAALALDEYGHYDGMHRKHPNIQGDVKLVEDCGLVISNKSAYSLAGPHEQIEKLSPRDYCHLDDPLKIRDKAYRGTTEAGILIGIWYDQIHVAGVGIEPMPMPFLFACGKARHGDDLSGGNMCHICSNCQEGARWPPWDPTD